MYAAPEQIMNKNYDYKVDIYSAGIIFFEMCCIFSTLAERAFTLRKLKEDYIDPKLIRDRPTEVWMNREEF